MAWSVTQLENHSAGANGTSITTGTLSIPANSLIVASCHVDRYPVAFTGATLSISDSVDGSTGWTAIDTGPTQASTGTIGGTGTLGLRTFVKQFTSSDSRTLTFTTSTTSYWGYNVVAVTGHDPASPIVQVKGDGTDWQDGGDSHSQSVTLNAAPTDGNLLLWHLHANNDQPGVAIQPSGWTSLSNTTTVFEKADAAYLVASSTSATVNCTDCGEDIEGALVQVVEIKAAPVGPTAVFFDSADWFATGSASRTVTSVAWSSGDKVVVVGAIENATPTFGTPSNAGLTFSAISGATLATGGSGECAVYFWEATAGSSQSGQTITATISDSSKRGGICCYVITNGGTTGNATTSRTESAISRTVSASSFCIWMGVDWSATNTDRTPATGSGTATERVDNGDTVNYGVHVNDWAGVSAGTFSFGVSSYSSMAITQGFIEIPLPAGATAPAQVTGLTATGASATSANLSWAAPADGGSAITDYTVEYSLNGTSWSTFSHTASTSTSITVTGLSQGTLYYFRVSAVNAIGTGTASSSQTATTWDVPSAPTGVTATPGYSQNVVAWSIPSANGSAITGYKVEFSTNGGSSWSNASANTGSTTASYTHTSLTLGTNYRYRISAINAVGTGSASSASSDYQTLDPVFILTLEDDSPLVLEDGTSPLVGEG